MSGGNPTGGAIPTDDEEMEQATGPVANSHQDENAPAEVLKGKGIWMLYTSRALTAWGDRLWSFGLGLFLFKLNPTSLSLMAGYGLARCITTIFLAPEIGRWIDKTLRLKAAKTFLLIQNTCVLLDCVVLAIYFHFFSEWCREVILPDGTITTELDDPVGVWEWVPHLVSPIVMVFALIAHLASNGSKITVEKDWIVVVSGGDDAYLARLNSVFRTIDLVCLTLAPVLAGLLFTYSNYLVTAAAVGGWNLISVVCEYHLLVAIYDKFPKLASKTIPRSESQVQTEEARGGAKKSFLDSKLRRTIGGWLFYMKHKVRNAGLALAFLYMTVLGFDSITWGYSLMQCVPEYVLGILVAVSAGFGILGSLTFPHLNKCVGKEKAGLVGFSSLVCSLSLCVVSVWLPGSPFDPLGTDHGNNMTDSISDNSSLDNPVFDRCILEKSSGPDHSGNERCQNMNLTSVAVLLSGIIVARFGLWISDLSVSQILQKNVEEQKRGIIGGVQTALNSTMDLLKFTLVLSLPNQNTFGILVILSFSFICMGGMLFFSYFVKDRKTSQPLRDPGKDRTPEAADPRPLLSKHEEDPIGKVENGVAEG